MRNYLKKMKRKYLLILFFGLSISLYAPGQSANQLYLIYCTTCHGQNMEGGRATTLIKTKWQHGGSLDSLINTISNGIPNTQMAKFKGMLTAKQIEDIAAYIRKSQKKTVSEK